MTTETEQTGEDFAAFEARVTSGEPETPPVEETPTEENPEVNDTLELTEDDEVIEEEGEETGEKKHRSKSARQRIDELTKARREAERERDELRAQLLGRAPATTTEEIGAAPDPEAYEFGEADPQFIRDTINHGVKAALAEERAKTNQEAAKAEAAQTLTTLDSNWQEATSRGAEAYEDFAEAVEDFTANAPCPPLMAAAIQASDVAEHVTYHLAKNQDVAHLIAAELSVNPMEAARRLGEIEGQYMDKRPVAPGRDAHPLEHALHAGRMKAFVEKKPKPAGKVVTDAPTPPKHQVRGAGGRFDKAPADMSFEEFERHARRAG